MANVGSLESDLGTKSSRTDKEGGINRSHSFENIAGKRRSDIVDGRKLNSPTKDRKSCT